MANIDQERLFVSVNFIQLHGVREKVQGQIPKIMGGKRTGMDSREALRPGGEGSQEPIHSQHIQ